MVAGTAIILLFCGYLIQRQIVNSRAEYTSALHWNNSLKTAQGKVKYLKAKDESLQKIYLAINAGSFSRPESVDILKTISEAIPSKKPVYLTQLACEHDGLVTIRGNTTSNSAVTDIVLALQKSGIFYEAQIGFLGDLQNGIQRKTGAPASQNGLPGLSGLGSAPSPAADTQHVLNFLITCRLYLSQGTNVAGTTADNTSGTGEASQ
jgi:Tfp pilus assembly protein PilN